MGYATETPSQGYTVDSLFVLIRLALVALSTVIFGVVLYYSVDLTLVHGIFSPPVVSTVFFTAFVGVVYLLVSQIAEQTIQQA